MMDQKPPFFALASLALAVVAAGIAVNACGEDSAGGGATGSGGGAGTSGSGATTQGTTSGTAATGPGPGAGGYGTVECDEPGGAIPPLQLTQIADGLDRPLYVTSEPNDASRLYVVEQNGTIRLIKDGVLQPTPFLDIRSLVRPWAYTGDEEGLEGLVFHPSYAENGRFFVYYVAQQGAPLQLVEFARSPSNPDVVEGTPEPKVIFGIPDEVATNHNGGMLAFGPDGMLYVGVGDGGGGGEDDPLRHGQNKSLKFSKILRINVDTSPPSAPQGNVPDADPFTWDYGLRNPWRFSFDRCNGDLYIGDVGNDNREEINIEPRGQGNRNYGWSILEGTSCFDPNEAPGCSSPTLTPPAKEYGHGNGDGSVTGGYVYRGSKIPSLRGTYFYGDFSSNRIWTLVAKNGQVQSEGELTDDLQSTSVLRGLASFGEDASGELYVVDYAPAPGGRIYRIEAE